MSVGSRVIEVEILADFGASVGLAEVSVFFLSCGFCSSCGSCWRVCGSCDHCESP